MSTKAVSDFIRSVGWNLLNFSLLIFALFIFGLIGIAVAANSGADIRQWPGVLESFGVASMTGFVLSMVLIGCSWLLKSKS